ncbi:MAG TPA: hypothetical protein VN836_05705 [Verrucomicrobiae bacterium]|nr:hypothetical protein [Verrucomicrobiae bacterium]
MTNAQRMKLIADANARCRRAQAAELDAKIELAVSRNKLSWLVAERNRRRKSEVEAAVKKLAKSEGGELMLAEQFLDDPALVSLALTQQIHRARAAQPDARPAEHHKGQKV